MKNICVIQRSYLITLFLERFGNLFILLHQTPDDFTCQVRIPENLMVKPIALTDRVLTIIDTFYLNVHFSLSNARQVYLSRENLKD